MFLEYQKLKKIRSPRVASQWNFVIHLQFVERVSIFNSVVYSTLLFSFLAALEIHLAWHKPTLSYPCMCASSCVSKSAIFVFSSNPLRRTYIKASAKCILEQIIYTENYSEVSPTVKLHCLLRMTVLEVTVADKLQSRRSERVINKRRSDILLPWHGQDSWHRTRTRIVKISRKEQGRKKFITVIIKT